MKSGLTALFVILCCACAPAQPATPRVLYSNDAVNIINSQRISARDSSIPELLRASIDEAASADVHMLQPGNGWVPWWKSRQYPADAHYRWFKEKTGMEPDAIGRFMMEGGDLTGEFVAHCRRRGVSPFVSLRLNDYHGSESWDILQDMVRGEWRGGKSPVDAGSMASQSRILLENRKNQLKPDPGEYANASLAERMRYISQPSRRISLRTARVWNWANPDVPAYKLGFVKELCEGYDIDGLELDFMRWSAFFRPDETTAGQRAAIMLDFIKKVRAALDATAKPGHRRWLCVRVPSRVSGHAPLGIDLPAWTSAGVDLVNLSCHYITEQQTELMEIRRKIPDTPVYLELTFASAGKPPSGPGAYRSAGDAQLYTAAHLAYARGARGVSLFNFAYYRTLGSERREPPFYIIPRLTDPQWLARQPQHYFLSLSGNPPSKPSEFARKRRLAPGKPSVFSLDLAPPAGGWTNSGWLRVQTTKPLAKGALSATLNGNRLAERPADAEQAQDWNVPAGIIKNGQNTLAITLGGEGENEIHFVEIFAR